MVTQLVGTGLEFLKGAFIVSTGTLVAIIAGLWNYKNSENFLGIGKGLLNLFKGGRSILRST